VVALFLRTPVALVAMRLLRSEERVMPVVVLSSGPLEEGVRVLVVLLVGRDLATALWIGLGWAAIEVVYAVINGFMLAVMTERNDPELERVRALMPPAMTAGSAPWWGIVERIFATCLHIGFTLIVAATPIYVIATALVHSLTNVSFVRAMRSYPMWLVMGVGTVFGAAVFAIGLTMHGVL
jgi:hypothetical protein